MLKTYNSLTCSNKKVPSTESCVTAFGWRKQNILKNNCHLYFLGLSDASSFNLNKNGANK